MKTRRRRWNPALGLALLALIALLGGSIPTLPARAQTVVLNSQDLPQRLQSDTPQTVTVQATSPNTRWTIAIHSTRPEFGETTTILEVAELLVTLSYTGTVEAWPSSWTLANYNSIGPRCSDIGMEGRVFREISQANGLRILEGMPADSTLDFESACLAGIDPYAVFTTASTKNIYSPQEVPSFTIFGNRLEYGIRLNVLDTQSGATLFTTVTTGAYPVLLTMNGPLQLGTYAYEIRDELLGFVYDFHLFRVQEPSTATPTATGAPATPTGTATAPTSSPVPSPTSGIPQPTLQPGVPIDSIGCEADRVSASYTWSTQTAAGSVSGECIELLLDPEAPNSYIVAVVHSYKLGEGAVQTSAIKVLAGQSATLRFNGTAQLYPSKWLADNELPTVPTRDINCSIRAWVTIGNNAGLITTGALNDMFLSFANCRELFLPLIQRT